MAMVVRVYRYAKQHVEQAENLLGELVEIRKKLDVKAERAENVYTDALASGDIFVPIVFMRRDNEFNRYKVRMEEKQNQVVLNLSLSLSFCAELVHSMIHDPSEEALGYKIRVRHIVDRVIDVATDEAMDRASLAPLAPAIAKIESEITLNDFDKLGLIKKHLMSFRDRMS
ncbi:MAG: hypothetical protein J5952_09320 [Prevotella sp.]|nr:hypothetical protein [Prevotella sp.]MBO5580598.1 hypothetical protein [Prevotella sp.]